MWVSLEASGGRHGGQLRFRCLGGAVVKSVASFQFAAESAVAIQVRGLRALLAFHMPQDKSASGTHRASAVLVFWWFEWLGFPCLDGLGFRCCYRADLAREVRQESGGVLPDICDVRPELFHEEQAGDAAEFHGFPDATFQIGADRYSQPLFGRYPSVRPQVKLNDLQGLPLVFLQRKFLTLVFHHQFFGNNSFAFLPRLQSLLKIVENPRDSVLIPSDDD